MALLMEWHQTPNWWVLLLGSGAKVAAYKHTRKADFNFNSVGTVRITMPGSLGDVVTYQDDRSWPEIQADIEKIIGEMYYGE
jgi:hypothetical protein